MPKSTCPDKISISFMDLPFEVREIVYFQLIRPWDTRRYGDRLEMGCANALGCTNVLLLNKIIYSEAIEIVHKVPAKLRCQYGGGRIFRHPLGHGKPNFFHSSAPSSVMEIDAGLTELEFVKLRTVNVHVRYGPGAYNDPVEDLEAIISILDKSYNLKEIHLVIGPMTAVTDSVTGAVTLNADTDSTEQVRQCVQRLIARCVTLSISLTASHPIVFLQTPGQNSKRDIVHENYTDTIEQYVNNDAALIASNDRLALNVPSQRSNCAVLLPFLQPECKRCYAIFGTTCQLQVHLDQNPSHNVCFREKQWNPISPLAQAGGDRHACNVCARSFVSGDSLRKHCQKFKHHRRNDQGVVPRWKEDNRWFSVMVWKKHWSTADKQNASVSISTLAM